MPKAAGTRARASRAQQRTPSPTTVASARPTVKPNANSPLLFDALQDKNFGLAEALIDENHGLSYVSKANAGNTVLHAAALNNAPTSIIKSLLEKGADPNVGNEIGRTPVYIAARHNVSLETMQLIISVGGDINKRDKYNYTPLMAASYMGSSVDLISLMVRLGARIGDLDSMGRGAVNWAIDGHPTSHPEVAAFMENITIMILAQVYHPRLGKHSLLKIVPKDILRNLKRALILPSLPPPTVTVFPPPPFPFAMPQHEEEETEQQEEEVSNE